MPAVNYTKRFCTQCDKYDLSQRRCSDYLDDAEYTTASGYRVSTEACPAYRNAAKDEYTSCYECVSAVLASVSVMSDRREWFCSLNGKLLERCEPCKYFKITRRMYTNTARREGWWTNDDHTAFLRCADIKEYARRLPSPYKERVLASMRPMTFEEFMKYHDEIE